jgi:zinc D-Ala-D-Ala carboxypeptidase
MNLTTHFTLEELFASDKAHELGIYNRPPQEIVPRLVYVAEMLERIRAALGGHPIVVTSGYRCEALNKAVGGVPASDHVSGHAADILVPGFGNVQQVAQRLAHDADVLQIGQLILEGVKGKQWVHVSTHAPMLATNRVLTITDAGPVVGIHDLA